MKRITALCAVILLVSGCASARLAEQKAETAEAAARAAEARELARQAQREELERRLAVLRENPNDATANHRAAVQCWRMRDVSEADRHWRKALELDPKHVKALYGLGVLRYSTDKREEAIKLWETAAGADPAFYLAFYNLGVAYHNLKQYQKALDAYKNALKAKPDHINSYINLGLAYFQLHRDDDMVAAWRQGLKRAPNNIQLNYNLGAIEASKVKDFATVPWREQDKADKAHLKNAVSLWSRASKNEPDSPSARKGLAMVNYSLGEYYDYRGGRKELSKAFEYMKRAYELDPTRAQIKHRMSAVARKLRRMQ